MILKKILFSLLSVFLVFQSYELMHILLHSNTDNQTLFAAFVNAFLLNLFVTGIFAFPGFVFPTHRILPDSFYTLKNPELLIQVYSTLQVNLFRKALMIFFWGLKKNRVKYFDGKRSGIENLIYQSKQSEFGHAGAFIIVLILSIVLLLSDSVVIFLFALIINVIGNAYPVILQRHHRMRIEKLGLRQSE